MSSQTPEDALLKASKDATNYFERFDKSSLHDAGVRRSTHWLLSEEAAIMDASDHFIPMIRGLQQPSDQDQGYTLLIPWPKCLEGSKQLYLQELHQITRELVEGIFVFNQIPSISFESNHDSTTSCYIPSAYQDTLIGDAMLTVDYFIKSLLHGTTINGKDKRGKVLEEWRKIPPGKIHQRFTEFGLTSMTEDCELGADVYTEKKRPFIRYPPKFLDCGLALKQLQPRLSTSEDHSRQLDHMGQDMFRRYLDHVSIGLVFKQRSVQQHGKYIILEPCFDITTSVVATLKETGPKLYSHLHSYLQKQRDFIASHLQTKRQISYYIQLLGFVSFMVHFLVSLKKQNRIVDVSQFLPRMSKELLRTDRDLPPMLPSKESRWSPYTAENNYTGLHGSIEFHMMPINVLAPSVTTAELNQFTDNPCSATSEEMLSCSLAGTKYYCYSITTERFYLQSPKLPRWVHAMVTELKSQVARQPAITESRVQDILRKLVGPRQVAAVKNINVLLQLTIERGLLPAVSSLLKRCTQTRLNKTDEAGLSLLHYAAVNGHGSVASVLILSGCNVSQPVCDSSQHPKDTLPIHLACQSGGLDAVCCLQHYGADLTAKDGNGWSPIHYATFHNCQAIVSHLVSVDESFLELVTSDKARSTPLLLAAQNGCFDTFKTLVDLGAALKVTNSSHHNPVHVVVLQHHISIVQYLINSKCSETDCVMWETFVEMLSSDSVELAEAAGRMLDALMKKIPDQVSKVIQYDVVSLLVQLLKKEESLKLMAIQALANMSNLEVVKTALLKANAIPSVVNLLTSTNDRIQACTCLVLSDLGLNNDNRESISQAGALPHLVKLLQSEQDDVQAYACATVGILCICQPSVQKKVAELSAIPILISMLQSPQSCTQGCAANAIKCVVKSNEDNQLSTLNEGAVPHLVVLLRSRDPPVHNSAAEAIEALAENCRSVQKELIDFPACIDLLKRLLMMRDPAIKVCGGCALWAIAGELISDKRHIAAHIGLALLVDMLAVNHERLNYVCSEALGALASELGDNQMQILQVGGVKPLLDVLSSPSSQTVCLSVIHTIAAICMKPALVPNPEMQRKIGSARGVNILAAIVSSKQVSDIVRVEAACALAKLVLNNEENDALLVKHQEFTYLTVFKFLSSSDSSVRLLGGYCLSVMAFNNPEKIEKLKTVASLHVSNFYPFLDSTEEFHQVHAAFQVVILSKILTGVRAVDIAVKGMRRLVGLLASEVESTKVQSAEFIASLAHTGEGIPNTLVMAGALENLMQNLKTGSGPVIENCSVALGYLTFNPLAARLITGMFRDTPELYDTFKKHFGTIVVSRKFLSNWGYVENVGLPSLSLTMRGGPSIITGRRASTGTGSDNERSSGRYSRMDSSSQRNSHMVRFGYDRKTHKLLREDKKVDVGFLVHRKSSLPEAARLLPKRRQTVPSPKGVKGKSTVRMATMTTVDNR